jgi:hypothetical protein
MGSNGRDRPVKKFAYKFIANKVDKNKIDFNMLIPH